MTLRLLPVDDNTLQFNFDKIAHGVLETGTRQMSLRCGVDTFAYTAGTSSAVVTVTHGLGKTPLVVFLQTDTGESMNRTLNVGAVTFQAQGVRTAVTTASYTFFWLAIG